jgi:hypothetical protein
MKTVPMIIRWYPMLFKFLWPSGNELDKYNPIESSIIPAKI